MGAPIETELTGGVELEQAARQWAADQVTGGTPAERQFWQLLLHHLPAALRRHLPAAMLTAVLGVAVGLLFGFTTALLTFAMVVLAGFATHLGRRVDEFVADHDRWPTSGDVTGPAVLDTVTMGGIGFYEGYRGRRLTGKALDPDEGARLAADSLAGAGLNLVGMLFSVGAAMLRGGLRPAGRPTRTAPVASPEPVPPTPAPTEAQIIPFPTRPSGPPPEPVCDLPVEWKLAAGAEDVRPQAVKDSGSNGSGSSSGGSGRPPRRDGRDPGDRRDPPEEANGPEADDLVEPLEAAVFIRWVKFAQEVGLLRRPRPGERMSPTDPERLQATLDLLQQIDHQLVALTSPFSFEEALAIGQAHCGASPGAWTRFIEAMSTHLEVSLKIGRLSRAADGRYTWVDETDVLPLLEPEPAAPPTARPAPASQPPPPSSPPSVPAPRHTPLGRVQEALKTSIAPESLVWYLEQMQPALGRTFTQRDMAATGLVPDEAIPAFADYLREIGLIELVTPRRGAVPAIYRLAPRN